MVLKTVICEQCKASFVPKEKEKICEICENIIHQNKKKKEETYIGA